MRGTCLDHPSSGSSRAGVEPERALRIGSVGLTVGGFWRLLVGPCRVEAAREGDGERVQCWLPPVHPSFLGGAGGVKGTRHEVQAFEGGLSVGKWPRALTAVRNLALRDSRVRRADDAADVGVVAEEGCELFPRGASKHDRGWVLRSPGVGELVEPGGRGRGGGGRGGEEPVWSRDTATTWSPSRPTRRY